MYSKSKPYSIEEGLKDLNEAVRLITGRRDFLEALAVSQEDKIEELQWTVRSMQKLPQVVSKELEIKLSEHISRLEEELKEYEEALKEHEEDKGCCHCG